MAGRIQPYSGAEAGIRAYPDIIGLLPIRSNITTESPFSRGVGSFSTPAGAFTRPPEDERAKLPSDKEQDLQSSLTIITLDPPKGKGLP